jgi:hypothetical protein
MLDSKALFETYQTLKIYLLLYGLTKQENFASRRQVTFLVGCTLHQQWKGKRPGAEGAASIVGGARAPGGGSKTA